METETVFKEIISGTLDFQLSAVELQRAVGKLKEIAKYNLAYLDERDSVSDKAYAAWIKSRIDKAFTKVVNSWLEPMTRADEMPEYYSSTPKDGALKSPAKSLIPSSVGAKLNLNRATWEELESIPGISKANAVKIMKSRQMHGDFSAKEDLYLKKILSKAEFESAAPYLYASPSHTVPYLCLNGMDELLEKRDIKSLVSFCVSNKCFFTRGAPAKLESNRKSDVVFKILDATLIELKNDPFIYKGAKARARDVEAHYKMLLKSNAIMEGRSNVGVTALINDSKYGPIVAEALRGAKSEIKVIMFFFSFIEKNEKYPTAPIMQELVKAKERGVDVKVILDRDKEADIYGSHIINKEAYEYLKSKGISVRYDSEETATHTKMVLIDGSSAIIGSHNWTAGSFFSYDDKSLFFHSSDFYQICDSRFNELWKLAK